MELFTLQFGTGFRHIILPQGEITVGFFFLSQGESSCRKITGATSWDSGSEPLRKFGLTLNFLCGFVHKCDSGVNSNL